MTIERDQILTFFESQNIEYSTEGPNVKKDNITIQCPFCGANDPSQHMGISLLNGEYACWRDSKHRGKNFLNLVQEILICSKEEAKRILGLKTLNEGELTNLLDKLFKEEVLEEKKLGGVTSIRFEKTFRRIDSSILIQPFRDYLLKRGLDDIDRLSYQYGLLCALTGDWRYRIIFPIYYQGELVSWVGRSISPTAELKYRDLDVNKSVRHVKFCLWNYDELLNGGKVLFITEGVFDAIKLDYYAPKGYRATCLFTKTMRDEQQALIKELSRYFKEIILLLDSDAEVQAMDLKSELSYIKNIRLGSLPPGVKDPGDLQREEVKILCGRY